MLFIVPTDDPQDPAQGRPSGAPSDASSERARAKVELDMDDAPFLEVEPEPEAEPEPEPEPEEKPQAGPKPEKPARPSLMERLRPHKKKLILAGGVAVLLIVAFVGLNVFLGREKEPEPAPAPEPQVVTITVPGDSAPPLAQGPAFVITWEPFWVEQRGSEGELRFLVGKFSLPLDNAQLKAEVEKKELLLRDAVYYYLKNRPMTLLTDEATINALKGDIISIINEQLTVAKIGELYIEDYRIIGP